MEPLSKRRSRLRQVGIKKLGYKDEFVKINILHYSLKSHRMEPVEGYALTSTPDPANSLQLINH